MKQNQLKIGAILSYVNLLVGNIIPFIYTPLMLRMLGQAEYGLYGIANSIMGYIGLLNFGIGGTIVRYISKYRAEGDTEQESRVIGLFVKIYSVICCLIFMVGFFCAFNIDFYGRSLSASELDKLQILIVLMTFNAGIFLPFSVFNSIVMAHERYIFNKLVGLLTTVISPILNLVLLYGGFGSVGLVISSTIMHLITYSVYTVYSVKYLKIYPNFKKCDSNLLGEILRYSAFVFLASIVDVLYWTTDKLIIGWAKGTEETAIYNIGGTFNGYVTSLSTAISGLLIPRLTEMVVKKSSKEEFTKIFIKVGRLQFIIVSFIVSAFVALGRQFIEIWAGPEYWQSYYIALLTMIPVTVPLIQNTGINILYALNKHQFRSIVYAVIAVINVILTFWWVEDFGIIGAAMATCIAYVMGNIIVMNWYYYKEIEINIPAFWREILKMSPVMFFMGTIAWFAMGFVNVSNWLTFFSCAAVYTIVYIILAYIFMMNNYEREIITNPIRKLLRRFNKEI